MADPKRQVSAHPPDRDATASADAVLEMRGLRVETRSGDAIVHDVSLSVAPGEALGLVGESGCGKTTSMLSLLGYAQPGTRIVSGQIAIGQELFDAASQPMTRALRGRLISYVPQNPSTALVPTMRVGDAVADMLRAHAKAAAVHTTIDSVLQRVGLPSDRSFQRRYPHQLSGGQQQRLCLAVALACEPPVIVLDEPTTGLDVATQAKILAELVRLRREQGIAMLYVTHDLAVVASFADRIAVMYAGRIVEQGPTHQLLANPKHPYTRGLVTSTVDHLRPGLLESMHGVAASVGEHPAGCSFAPRCPLRIDRCEEAVPELRAVSVGHQSRCYRAEVVTPVPRAAPLPETVADGSPRPVLTVTGLRAEHRSRHETVVAAENVSISIEHGRCVALVGESGSGKTTIARAISGAHPRSAGEILLGGEALAPAANRRSRRQRQRIQFIFQNPSDALNPKHTVRTIIARPTRLLRGLSKAEAIRDVDRLLDLVRLPRRLADRYPSELSGGERQRVGIARALAAEPEVIICDEITSALDVSVQAAVLALLAQLRDDLGLALLFITHDLGVVTAIADYVLVLERGQVVEEGPPANLLRAPAAPYTKSLLDAAPSVSHVLDRLPLAEGTPRG